MRVSYTLVISASLIVVGTAIIISLLRSQIPITPPINETVECLTDKDCGIGGCSGEVCTTLEKSREVVTPCIWRPEFECLRLTSCGCIEGKCRWEENRAYRECMEEKGIA